MNRPNTISTTSKTTYPFGMHMPGRSFSSGSYRYGFNGKESDDEVSGTGNQYDYGFRIYNPRIGKFLSVDPLTASYPWYTPYQFAGNKPIWAVDLEGLEEFYTTKGELIYSHNNNGVVYVVNDDYVNMQVLTKELVRTMDPSTGEFNYQMQYSYQNVDYSNIAAGSIDKNSAYYTNLMSNSSHSQIGDELMDMYYNDPSAYYNGQAMQCSPTSFKRYKSAYENFFGEGSFGPIGGVTYGIWNMYGASETQIPEEYRNTSTKPDEKTAGPGALHYKGATDKMLLNADIWSGAMEPGGVLRLTNHSVIFLGYTYDENGAISGLNFWDQHATKEGDTYYFGTISREDNSDYVVSGANPNR
jgi:RHS repeat-associated protein